MGRIADMAGRVYGGISSTDRQSTRRAALLDAALDVIAEDGVAAVTVRGVCGRARLADRYFYENFSDRDALLDGLADELFTQVGGALLAAITAATSGSATADPAAVARAGVETAIAFVTEDPRRGRLLVEARGSAALQQHLDQAVRVLATLTATQASDLLGERAPSPQDTDMAAFTLVSGGLELLRHWLCGELAVSRHQLTEFLIAMFVTTTDLATALAATLAPTGPDTA